MKNCFKCINRHIRIFKYGSGSYEKQSPLNFISLPILLHLFVDNFTKFLIFLVKKTFGEKKNMNNS